METISRQELKAKLDADQDIKLVMTVGGWTFRARHVPGSLGFPSPGCAPQRLRRDDEIIVYSTSDGRRTLGLRSRPSPLTGTATSAATKADSLTGRAPATRSRAPAWVRPLRAAGRMGTVPRVVSSRWLPTLRQRLVRIRMAGSNRGPRLLGRSARHGRYPARTAGRLAGARCWRSGPLHRR
jgi:hypothetical protein